MFGPIAHHHREVPLSDFFGGAGDIVHRDDERVQIVLDGVELAVIRVGDLRRKIALADAIHIVGRDVERSDDRVENGVHAAHDAGISALKLFVIASLG